jgi:hypothetical protein
LWTTIILTILTLQILLLAEVRMNLTTKKIIAREFLVLLSLLVVGLVIFLCTYLRNYYFENKLSSLDKQLLIKKKASDSLAEAYTKNTIIKYGFLKQWKQSLN